MKSYRQYCGVARALDLVGGRWALLLVRDLLPGPRRFTDLLRPGLTPNVLSTRLRELSEAGLVQKVTLPAPAGRAWALTEQGRGLEPVVLALGAFGQAYLSAPRPDDSFDGRWFVVSLQRRFRGPGEGRVQLWIDGAPYRVQLGGGRASVRDGVDPSASLTVRGSLPEVAATLSGGEGAYVDGDRAVLERLVAGTRVLGGS